MSISRIVLLFCVLCFGLGLVDPASLRARETLTVAIDGDYAPYTLLTPDGKLAGMYVEMWRLWSQETGIPVRFVHGTWERTLEMVRSGEADVHSGLFESESRSRWLLFSDPFHSIKSAFYYRVHDTPPRLDALAGERVGVVAGAFQHEYLGRNYPDAAIVTYPGHRELLSALASGEVACVFDEVLPIMRMVNGMGWNGLVARLPDGDVTCAVRAAVARGRDKLMARINEGFRNLNPLLLASLEKRWIADPRDRHFQAVAQRLDVNLTEEETAFLLKHKTISLASTPNWPPFEMRQEDDSYAGIAADFIRLAASKVGLAIVPEFDSNWGAHVDRLKARKLDVAPGLNRTAKRLENFIFTTPYIEYYSAIFAKSDRDDIKSPQDLAGKTVALENGYAIARNLPTDRPDIKIMLVKGTQEALDAVSTGKADAYIGNQVVAAYLIKKFTLPNLKPVSLWRTDLPGQLRFAVHKGRPVLRSILQKGLDAITKKEREAILSTYMDVTGFQQNVFSLTQEQWDWLKAHPVLRLGANPAAAPLEFVGEGGALQGISSEYASFVADKLKVEMPVVQGLSWSEVLARVESGEVDVLSAIARTPKREAELLFTDPYIEFPIVIFSKKEAPLVTGVADLAGGRVAVVEAFAAQEFLAADHPDLAPVAYGTVEQAVSALARDEVDWFVGDVATGSYAIEKQGLTTLKVATTTDYTMALAMAVRKDMPKLAEILNKALGVVSEQQSAEFKGKWLALTFEHGLDMKTVLTWVVPIAAGVLAVLLLVVLWNRKLGGEIAQRKRAQAELAATMQSLDEKNDMLEGLSSKLGKYLSPQVYDSIFSGSRDVTLSTARKMLTVFFSDIKDFTQTTDDLQPEDLTALLNSYFTEMSAIALEYGATIDKFIGDAMLMFFGDPESKGVKEDAELCVRMAVAMQERMLELEREWRAQGYNKPFKMRIGINTGYCNVGNFGSESRMDYTIIGGEVNLAARLESQADPGGILMSSETHALVNDIVETEERDPLSVKGIRRRIRPHAVLCLRRDSGRADRGRLVRIAEDGFDLSLDLDALPEEKRGAVARRLEDLAKRLGEEQG